MTHGILDKVWRKLPADLQTKVAEDHLPVSSLCRFRSVSRSWSKPKLRPGTLSGLYIRRSFTKRSCRFSIFGRDGGQAEGFMRRTSRKFSWDMRCLTCVNGLVTCIRRRRQDLIKLNDIKFMVCDLFSRTPWTRIPSPPPAPDRYPFFAAMSKRCSGSDPPRLGLLDCKLDDYVFVAGLGDHDKQLRRPTNLLLQVYSSGTWSCSMVDFPHGCCLMYSRCGLKYSCGVLRGSVFYLLMMRLDKTSATLCCIDLLTSDRRCMTVAQLDNRFVTEWDVGSRMHPKLAICAGKILLVYQHELPEKDEQTIGVQVFDEEKMAWRCLSVLPLELRGDKRFEQHRVHCGGDELLVFDILNQDKKGLVYNLATDKWSAISLSLDDDVLPMSVC